MITTLSPEDVAKQISERYSEAVIETSDYAVLINSQFLLDVAAFLKDTPDLEFDYLTYITAVDYFEYFELIYQLTSIKLNHTMVLKTRCYGRENPTVPSVVSLWRGADYQEREIYDLMGIKFEGHPNMKRIVLWDGFQGHPLRKDYL
ncbi:MAG: NADH-quinone oxidoreductase subunit C [Chloroflexi bacterium]|jgi:NADH-quinone oxidoreductase subunit C|nr:NADH-quinone oxidoreductase subunit C [Chloroflexota bacterium]